MKYISLNKYMELYNIGYETALKMLHLGKVDYIKTTGGRYKIAIPDETVSYSEYERVIRENEKLKTIINNIYNISKEVNDV